MLQPQIRRLLSVCISVAAMSIPSTVWAAQSGKRHHISGIGENIAEQICGIGRAQASTKSGGSTEYDVRQNGYWRSPSDFGVVLTSSHQVAQSQRLSREHSASAVSKISHCGQRMDERLLIFAQSMGASGQPGWIMDPRNGCSVWNTEPQPDETLSWSGSCLDGKASGRGTAIFRTRSGSTRVNGSMREGRLEGPATIIGADGTRIQAAFVNGMAEGKMLSVTPDGTSFETTAVNNKSEGPATLTLPGHIRIAGNFSHRSGNVFVGPATITTPNFRYEGLLDNRHRPHGRGSLRVAGDVPRTTTWNHGCSIVRGTVVAIGASTSECSRNN
jgi:hypothetical protein